MGIKVMTFFPLSNHFNPTRKDTRPHRHILRQWSIPTAPTRRPALSASLLDGELSNRVLIPRKDYGCRGEENSKRNIGGLPSFILFRSRVRV
jgi:hypothetical protein